MHGMAWHIHNFASIEDLGCTGRAGGPYSDACDDFGGNLVVCAR